MWFNIFNPWAWALAFSQAAESVANDPVTDNDSEPDEVDETDVEEMEE